MHAWEAIQKTLNHIEDHINEDIQIEVLAEIAALSLFYYQRLFARLVKKPVREYIKLRRLARACEMLKNRENRIIDVAAEYGFGSHEVFTRAFKSTYGITPAQYRNESIRLNNFEKPDLLLNYIILDEGVPLISDGLVLEMNRMILAEPIHFLGVEKVFPFRKGKMLGERPGIDVPGKVWEDFNKILPAIRCPDGGRHIGICYHGKAPDGYTTYFAGTEVRPEEENPSLVNWCLPAREYAVCGFEAESMEHLKRSALGRAMKYTRFWLKDHGLTADGFFPEMYYPKASDAAYMELWTPFKQRSD